jgi:fatty-acyl-CoA synthase
VFLRLVDEMAVTGTLKQRKIDLQNDGYDPERAGPRVYLRDDSAASYVPLTAALCDGIATGGVRL